MAIKIGKSNLEYEQLVTYGSDNVMIIDKLSAFLLVVSPILQQYRGLYENAGFTVLLFAFPFLFLRFVTCGKRRKMKSGTLTAIMPLILFELYTAVDHSISADRLLYVVFMILIFLFIAKGCVNTVYFLKYALNIICLAAIILVVQYVSYYLLHHEIDLRPLNLLVNQDSIWIQHLDSANADMLYRPSAFFLEPSHLFLYSFPVLCILLLSPNMTKWRKKKAILITLALLLSTSGFSIVLCVGLWSLYLLVYKKSDSAGHISYRNIFSGRNIAILVALIVLLIISYFYIPVFQRSVNRIFTDTEGTNAIDGRVRLALNYVSTISGQTVLFGTANISSDLEFNLSGFFATYINWGVIGLVLTYWFYGRGLFRLKKKYFWMSLIIIVISFFTAHTHGTFYMLFYVVFLMNGYYEKQLNQYQVPLRNAARA